MDAAGWDARFAGSDYWLGTEPSPFLLHFQDRFRPGGRALAVADGEGRNGVWLAEKGLEVVSVDWSTVALEKARALAALRGVSVETVRADLFDWAWPTAAFDAVVSVFFHPPSDIRPRLHRAMLAALRPGGLVFVEAFHPDQFGRGTGGPPDADRLMSATDLAEDFRDAEIEVLEEREVRFDCAVGDSKPGPAALTFLVGRKPESAD